MVQINGKYAHQSNDNFEAYILSFGEAVTPDVAKKYADSKSSLEIKLNGNQCTIASSSGRTETFNFGQAFKDDLFPGQEIQSTVTMSGDNKIEVKSVNKSGVSGTRIYEFTDSGLTITYTSPAATAKRTYKRV